jgi:hypothetical protein
MMMRGLKLEYIFVWALLAIFSLNSCNEFGSDPIEN